MNCKFCQAEMPDDAAFCPYCGKNNNDELVEEAAAVEALLEEEGEAVVVADGGEPEAVSDLEEAAQSPQIRKMKRLAIFSGCLAVLAILGTVLFFGIRGSGDGSGDGWDVASWFAWMKPRQDTLLGNDSYTVSDRKAAAKRNEIVATLGDAQLTNGQLQVYYWMQVIEFINEYGYYLSYVGMDYTKPLDEQPSMEEGKTWQQYFLESALDMWHNNQAFALEAQKEGYQLDKEYQDYLDGLLESMEATAKKQGFESADAMLQKEMGPGCLMEDYLEYMQTYYTSYMYFGDKYDALEPTADEISKFFEDNKEELAEQNITKDSGKYYAFRHIQINVEGGTKDEDGKVTYTEAEWTACKDAAQKLLDTWLAGEKTEDSFAALVKDNTDDSSSVNYGGLYSGVTKGSITKVYGEEMENWIIDEARVSGDCQLIQSSLGYHLVFFVESEDIWFAESRQGVLEEMGTKLVADVLEKYPMEVNYKKIVLGEADLAA